MIKDKIESKEIFGAEVQYFRLDPKYWEKIIVALKETGLRTVTTYVQWGTHLVGEPDEKHPAGHLDFEGKTDPKLNLMRFIELIEKHGMNLNFRCGPFCCNEMVHGGYPPWLVMGDPNIMVWDYQNRTTQGYWIGKKEGSQPSYLHPEYLDWCNKWIDEVDKIIIPHLKSNGGCITMLNLDNEVSYIVQDGFLSSDYNPINVAPGGYYHQFLESKYGNIQNLKYGKKYDSFEEIKAPRQVPKSIGEDLAYYLDWCEFSEWTMAEYIRRLREMHEANGVNDVMFMTNFNPHLPEGVPTRMPAFEEASGGIVGYDFYRGTFMSYSGYHSMARVLKLMNASLKYTWSAEFMSGTWNKILPSRVSDDHMRFMARCALAHGCKAIDWFMFHDRDCWGDAPVSSHGHRRTNYNVLKEIPEILFDKIVDWDSLVPQGDVGIVYDLIQHRHTYLGDPSPCADNNLHIGVPEVCGTQAGRSTQEYMGLFRLVEQAGYQANVVDIIHLGHVPTKYPVIFIPGSPVIEMSAVKSLEEYITNGGIVVMSGSWPEINESGEEIKFIGLDQPNINDSCTIEYGKGKLVWYPDWIAQEKPEEECLSSIKIVKDTLKQYTNKPHVLITPVESMKWVDWNKTGTGGGHIEYSQPRNLGSAILHTSDQESILFVLNHYPDAASFKLEFKNQEYKHMENLVTGEVININDGKSIVDVDRKCAEIFKLLV